LKNEDFNRALFPFKYVPFTAIPPVRLRPEMPDILRQWIYGFYTKEDDDAFLFLRIHLVMLLINIGICAFFIAAFHDPSILGVATPGKVVSIFLLQYPARIVPCLVLAASILTLLTFAVQSRSLRIGEVQDASRHIEAEGASVYEKASNAQYIGTLLFTIVALYRLDVIPKYFAGYKLYAGAVDLVHEPWRTMMSFMPVYVFFFQLFVVNALAFCVIALSRSALLRLKNINNN